VAGLLDQIAGLADTPQKRAALAALVGELEKNPAHPPERFNRGVRNVAGGMAKAIGEGIAFPRKYMETYQPGSMAADNPAATEWAAGTAMNMVGAPMLTGGVPGMGAGIRAYHGSPHDFDRFDMSKIGTGEGAQAYGHGLYFAENPAVALEYKTKLAGGATIEGKDAFRGWDWLNSTSRGMASHALKEAKQYGYSGDEAVRTAIERLKIPDGAGQSERMHYVDAQNAIGSLIGKQWETSPGRMYEVNINAAPEQFLDWDRPLAQHGEPAKRALNEAWGLPSPEAQANMTGRDVYSTIAQTRGGERMIGQGSKQWGPVPFANEPAATEFFREAGIPGIKYLDQGSRATSGGELIDVFKGPDGWQSKIRVDNRTGIDFQSPAQMFTTSKPYASRAEAEAWAKEKIGGGTNNYVVFDDKIIEILRKYGLAGLAAMPALANAPQLEQAQ
jgi:hypothetical protein